MILDLAQCSTCQLPLTVLLWMSVALAGVCGVVAVVLLLKLCLGKF